MSWPIVPFGAIAEFRNGLNYTRDNHGCGLKVINVGDFGTRFSPDIEALGEIDPNGIADEADYLSKDDLLFVRSNGNRELIGRVMHIAQTPEPLGFSAFCIRARITSPLVVSRFYAYFFRSGVVRKMLSSIGGGANIANLNQGILGGFPVPFPGKPVQELVVERLDAFEAYISNAEKRIELLEETARLIYMEWFVQQRFPDHENTRFDGSLPEGWKQSDLGELVELNYGKSLKESERQPGDVPVYGSSGIVGTHANALSQGPGIIVGRKGNVGNVFYSPVPFFPIDTVYFVAPAQTSFFLLHTLRRMNFISSDAAVPGLNRNYAYAQPVIWPSASVLNDFEALCAPIYQQIETLEKQITQLRQARDLLLPRLISGQLRL